MRMSTKRPFCRQGHDRLGPARAFRACGAGPDRHPPGRVAVLPGAAVQPPAPDGLVESTRGPGGGYTLGRRPVDISAADIVNAVEDDLPEGDEAQRMQLTRDLWAELTRSCCATWPRCRCSSWPTSSAPAACRSRRPPRAVRSRRAGGAAGAQHGAELGVCLRAVVRRSQLTGQPGARPRPHALRPLVGAAGAGVSGTAPRQPQPMAGNWYSSTMAITWMPMKGSMPAKIWFSVTCLGATPFR
jgi:hypothetical protein